MKAKGKENFVKLQFLNKLFLLKRTSLKLKI